MEPFDNGFTIYSKSGCSNCTKVKKLLLEKQFFFVDISCDEFLIENKEHFEIISVSKLYINISMISQHVKVITIDNEKFKNKIGLAQCKTIHQASACPLPNPTNFIDGKQSNL